MQNDKEEALERVNAMQQSYAEAMRAIQSIREMVEALPHIDENVNALQAYYQTQWRQDVDAIPYNHPEYDAHMKGMNDKEYSILGQDTLWNMLDEYREESRALLKALVERI